MYFIKTNVDGCLVGNYYAEGFDNIETAKVMLKEVKLGDPKAKIYKAIELKED